MRSALPEERAFPSPALPRRRGAHRRVSIRRRAMPIRGVAEVGPLVGEGRGARRRGNERPPAGHGGAESGGVAGPRRCGVASQGRGRRGLRLSWVSRKVGAPRAPPRLGRQRERERALRVDGARRLGPLHGSFVSLVVQAHACPPPFPRGQQELPVLLAARHWSNTLRR